MRLDGMVHTRAARLAELYRLQVKIAAEIAAIETEVAGELEAIRRARADAAKAGVKVQNRRAQCGTDSGYYHHLRQAKNRPCDACRLAHRTAERARVTARNNRKGAA